MAELTVGFGESAAGKTTALGDASEYIYERSGGKPVRLICSDRSKWRSIQDKVVAGFIEPYYIGGEVEQYFPMLLKKLAMGYWPAKLEDGNRPAGVKLIAPTPAMWDNVGGLFWEGLTSSSELMMQYLRDEQKAIGQEAVGKFTIEDPDDKGPDGKPLKWLFCSNNQKHFGFAQDEILALLGDLAALPVERVIITAHEAAGSDDGEIIRGPGLAGKAGTPRVGKNVGDLLHFEVVSTATGVGPLAKLNVQRRVYFIPHPDPRIPNVTYKSKARVPKEMMPELLKKWPNGYFESHEFATYLRFTDELVAKGGALAAGRKAAIDARIAGKS